MWTFLRDRSEGNSVVGQQMTMAAVLGSVGSLIFFDRFDLERRRREQQS
jgi:hypothetical protein